MLKILGGLETEFYVCVLKNIMELIVNIDVFMIKILSGFTGIIVHKFLKGESIDFEYKKDLMKYFIYSLLTFTSINLLTIYIWSGFSLSIFRLLIPAIYAALWLIFRDKIVEFINWIYRKRGNNTIFIDDSLFARNFQDGKEHYLIVYKNNQIISYGFLSDWEEENNTISFSLIPPEKGEIYINRGFKISLIYSDKNIYIEEINVEKAN